MPESSRTSAPPERLLITRSTFPSPSRSAAADPADPTADLVIAVGPKVAPRIEQHRDLAASAGHQIEITISVQINQRHRALAWPHRQIAFGRKDPAALVAQQRNRRLPAVGHHHIAVPIPIHIPHRHRLRLIAHHQIDAPPKESARIAQHRHRVRPRVGRQQIQVAISIHIPQRHRHRLRPHRIHPPRRRARGRSGQKHRHRVVARIGRHQVPIPVPIHIAHRHKHRAAALQRRRAGRRKNSSPIVQEHRHIRLPDAILASLASAPHHQVPVPVPIDILGQKRARVEPHQMLDHRRKGPIASPQGNAHHPLTRPIPVTGSYASRSPALTTSRSPSPSRSALKTNFAS